jgi:hypothetical protein
MPLRWRLDAAGRWVVGVGAVACLPGCFEVTSIRRVAGKRLVRKVHSPSNALVVSIAVLHAQVGVRIIDGLPRMLFRSPYPIC